ncbi:MAG: DUF6511 domain-containing protein [Pseudomonadota bacterium]
MRCAVCLKDSRGFGYIQPPFRINTPMGRSSYRKFCSMRCQSIYSEIKRNMGDISMIDPTKNEKAAMQAALSPMGEYVASIGMTRGLDNYTKDKVLTLVEVIVTAYHDKLQELAAKEYERECGLERPEVKDA